MRERLAINELDEAEELATYFAYLDEVRESGATNMFGATPHLMEAYDLRRSVAMKVLSAWMDTFDPEKSAEQRATEALSNA